MSRTKIVPGEGPNRPYQAHYMVKTRASLIDLGNVQWCAWRTLAKFPTYGEAAAHAKGVLESSTLFELALEQTAVFYHGKAVVSAPDVSAEVHGAIAVKWWDRYQAHRTE